MRTKVTLLGLCFLIVVGCSFNNNLPRSQIISKTQQYYIPQLEPARIVLESTCKIYTFNKETDKRISDGTAILVSITSYLEGKFLERYVLITAAHVVEPTEIVYEKNGFIITQKNVEVYWKLESYRYDHSGKIISTQITEIKPDLLGVEIIRYKSIDITVIVLDVYKDLIFATPAPVKNNHGFATSIFWDKILISGCPNYQKPIVRKGRINQIGVTYKYPWINSVTCPVTNGDSGGGVFNTQGKLIGVIGITFNDGVGGGYIPLYLLQKKLNKDRPDLAALIWR